VGIVGAYSVLRIIDKLINLLSPQLQSQSLSSGADEVLANVENKLLFGSGKRSSSSNIESLQSMMNNKMRKRRRSRRSKLANAYGGGRRSLELDMGDRCYKTYGGIESVRVRACQVGLKASLVATQSTPAATTNNNDNITRDVETAISALQLSCLSRVSREYFVECSTEPLSILAKYIGNNNNNNSKKNNAIIPSDNGTLLLLLLQHSSKLIELRTLDALLRTLRDRHLIVASRLRRSCEFWNFRITLEGGRVGQVIYMIRSRILLSFPTLRPWLLAMIDGGIDSSSSSSSNRYTMYNNDEKQKQYELALAAYERELERLGIAERLLLQRPMELDVAELLNVPGYFGGGRYDGSTTSSTTDNAAIEERQDSERSMTQATQFLLQSKNRAWLQQTEKWSQEARIAIKDSLDLTISSSFTPINNDLSSTGDVNSGSGGDGIQKSNTQVEEVYAESKFLKKWANYDASDANSWLTVLNLVDLAASPKRAGEERRWYFQLRSLVRQYDFLGIPSSCLLLATANSMHDNIIAPHKTEILDFFKSIFTALWGIIEFRFYTPMKDILLDLLNRRPRMVDPFALLNEQTSLDNMLKDLGVGDGTRQTRAIALGLASRMYEDELKTGTIRGILRGRVAQLMLIQIQQLKSDLLQAMDSIDNLIDANRLNVQLVAAIPAVLIIFYGTRALYTLWSNIRMKDFRLPRDVHAEMADYLKKIEECLVLSNYQLDGSSSTSLAGGEPMPSKANAKELGHLLLLLHSYLNLLDYMSPPFPGKSCDSIHQSIQNLLMQGNMSTSRQLGLVKVIQSKHDDLLCSSKLI
jgi:nuclear-control-of-ATPase protein 2